jgi:hypothetical protein
MEYGSGTFNFNKPKKQNKNKLHFLEFSNTKRIQNIKENM